MTYALKNETQLTGSPEDSLLVAFANILERFGKPIDPVTLQGQMNARGITEIMFGSVSIIDSTVQVSNFSGPNVPTSNNTIMKFDYISPVTEQPTTFYALVEDATAGTIIDSYSGLTKSWAVYGGPGSFATYTNSAVQASESVPETPAPQPEIVTVNDTTAVPEASTTPEAPSITETHETFPTDGHEAVIIPVRVKPVDINSWQASYRPGLGVLDTTAIKNVTVTDLAGEQPDVELTAGTLVPVAGRFEKDGQAYYRTETSVANNTWYGVPAGSIIRSDKLNEDEDINAIYETSNQTPKDKVIKVVATAEGKAKKFFNFGKKK